LQTTSEIELIQKRISSLFQDPLCRILMEKSFFTEIQLETLLIDFLTYQTIEPRITQSSKGRSRQRAKGRSRGSYNRVLKQSRTKLEKALCSMLLLGYLGILGDTRSSTFIETSRKMQEYLEIHHHSPTDTDLIPSETKGPRKRAEIEMQLRRQLYQLLSGTKAVTS